MAFVASQPVRSISLPARSHPTSLKIDETINKLKSRAVFSSNQSTSCSGAENIQLGLLNLVELYAHVQELILSLSTQHGKVVEEALDSSVVLLDVCSNMRDLVLGLKERVCELQSALRRKGYSSTENEISMYLSFRKKVATDVARSLKILKQEESKYGINAPLLDTTEPCLVNLVRVFREVYSVSIAVFRSLFSFMSTPAKASGWSLISKLVTKNSAGGSKAKETGILNEVSKIDLALLDRKNFDVMLVRGNIQSLDATLQILEGELGCLYRCLLKNRVSLLNVLTQ